MRITEDPTLRPCPHVMIDLETADNVPTSAIVSIGAVCFDPATASREARFYRAVRLDERQKDNGMTIGRDTMAWWERQSESARAVFYDDDAVDIADALLDFRDWLRACGPMVHLWSHGAAFDLPILVHAFARFSMKWPTDFRLFRDTRTVFELADIDVLAFRDQATHHDALADADAQARAAIQALDTLEGRKAIAAATRVRQAAMAQQMAQQIAAKPELVGGI